MSNQTFDSPTAQSVENLTVEVQLLQRKQELELSMSPQGRELQLVKARQEAEFALTPVGQELKRFEINQRMGMMYAQSTIVPDTYKNNPANCAIAVDVALRMNANALMVMQNLYLVHGNPSWSSKFLIATINTCGRYQPLRYECNGEAGDNYGWRCYTYMADDKKKSERLNGPWVTWAMVKAEQWDKKNGSKWKTMPEQMFHYRAAAFWQRLYAPEISMGFNTVEESLDIAEDIPFSEIDPDGKEIKHPASPASPRRPSLAEMARQRAMQASASFTQEPGNEDSGQKEESRALDHLFVDPETGEVLDPSQMPGQTPE